MAITNVVNLTWADFKNRLARYSSLSLQRRQQLLFRGHHVAAWPLTTTLDRWMSIHSSNNRAQVRNSLLSEFQHLSSGLLPSYTPSTPIDWELLARHHGVPTPIIDWTESPYIAAFFAYEKAGDPDTGHVAIWVLDQERLAAQDGDDITLFIEDSEPHFNVRAIEQRGVFMRVPDGIESVEERLASALTKFVLPVDEKRLVLRELDDMLVNARQLFRDLDGAARTAIERHEE